MNDRDFDSALLSKLAKLTPSDDAAMSALISHVSDRLSELTRTMLRAFPGVKQWEETDDVFQNAVLRLIKSLREVRPESTRQFFGLASLQIRRELLDLMRHYYGALGHGANHGGDLNLGNSKNRPIDGLADSSLEPASLAEWGELHQQIERLSEPHREVVDLIFYHGLTQQDAAKLLGVNVRTIQRRWHAALLLLHSYLKGDE